MRFLTMNMPSFVIKELEKMQETISPVVKKSSKYGIWSFPLITLSVINVFSYLIMGPKEHMIALVVFSFIGAFGFALHREGKLQQKEILKLSSDYIIGRIRNSHVASDPLKTKYISLVKSEPSKIMNHFIHFLEEENRAFKSMG